MEQTARIEHAEIPTPYHAAAAIPDNGGIVQLVRVFWRRKMLLLGRCMWSSGKPRRGTSPSNPISTFSRRAPRSPAWFCKRSTQGNLPPTPTGHHAATEFAGNARRYGMTSFANSVMLLWVKSAGSVPNCIIPTRTLKPISFW